MRHQREAAQVAVAVVVALVGPDRVRHQIPIQRKRQRLGPDTDDFGRVPVGHHAVHRALTDQKWVRTHTAFDFALNALQAGELGGRRFRRRRQNQWSGLQQPKPLA